MIIETRPVGRPSEYKEEYCQKADEYIEYNQDEVYHTKLRVRLPTVEGFALFLGVSKKSLLNWEKEHEQFLHALDKIRTEQHNRLINSGLSGEYNSTIAKLILSSNHNYKEKTENQSEVIVKGAKELAKKLDEVLEDKE